MENKIFEEKKPNGTRNPSLFWWPMSWFFPYFYGNLSINSEIILFRQYIDDEIPSLTSWWYIDGEVSSSTNSLVYTLELPLRLPMSSMLTDMRQKHFRIWNVKVFNCTSLPHEQSRIWERYSTLIILAPRKIRRLCKNKKKTISVHHSRCTLYRVIQQDCKL